MTDPNNRKRMRHVRQVPLYHPGLDGETVATMLYIPEQPKRSTRRKHQAAVRRARREREASK